MKSRLSGFLLNPIIFLIFTAVLWIGLNFIAESIQGTDFMPISENNPLRVIANNADTPWVAALVAVFLGEQVGGWLRKLVRQVISDWRTLIVIGVIIYVWTMLQQGLK